MFAPVFAIAAADDAVKALLGSGSINDPVRFYPFGAAPQGVLLPYAVWRNTNGSPINYLNTRPDTDNFDLQIDVYGSDEDSVRAVSEALNNALEQKAYITRWGTEDRDPVTRNYHYDFDVELFADR